MSVCTRLSDRMPFIARGTDEWTREEAGHLEQCPECQTEWRLVQAATRLGGREPMVPDPDATGRAVLDRLRHRKRGLPSRAWLLSGLVAAGVGAAVWVGVRDRGDERTHQAMESVVAGLPMPLPELENLQAAELDSLLRTMDDPFPADPPPNSPGLGDLDTEELQRVLDTWEG